MRIRERVIKFATGWMLAMTLTVTSLSGCGTSGTVSSGNSAKTTGKKVSIGLSELQKNISEAEEKIDSFQLNIKGELEAEAKMNDKKSSLDGSIDVSADFDRQPAGFSGDGKVTYSVKSGGSTISGNVGAEIFGEKDQDVLDVVINANDKEWYTDTISVEGYQYLYDLTLSSVSKMCVSGLDESYDQLEKNMYRVNNADCYLIKKTINKNNAEDYFDNVIVSQYINLLKTEYEDYDFDDDDNYFDEKREELMSFLKYVEDIEMKTAVYIDAKTYLPVCYELNMECNLTHENQYLNLQKLSIEMDIVQGKAKIKDAPDGKKYAEQVDMELDSLVEEIRENEERIDQYLSSLTIVAVGVAVIAPNMTKYVGRSKTNTDKKNADEIASQLKTSITDYETGYDDLIAPNGDVLTIDWSSAGVTCSNEIFCAIVEATMYSNVQSKVDPTEYAHATISLKNPAAGADDGYVITVTLNNETVTMD